MNIFIRINDKTYSFGFKSGDNLDKYLIIAFQKHISSYGKNINNFVIPGNFNFLHSSNFIINGKSFRFGNNLKLDKNYNLSTANHYYLGGTQKNFDIDDINYIKSLMY